VTDQQPPAADTPAASSMPSVVDGPTPRKTAVLPVFLDEKPVSRRVKSPDLGLKTHRGEPRRLWRTNDLVRRAHESADDPDPTLSVEYNRRLPAESIDLAQSPDLRVRPDGGPVRPNAA